MKKTERVVTPEMIKKLQKDLKKYSLNGVAELAELMEAERNNKDSLIFKYHKEIKSQTIYNIFNGVITNGAMTITFYKVGLELLKKYEEKI